MRERIGHSLDHYHLVSSCKFDGGTSLSSERAPRFVVEEEDEKERDLNNSEGGLVGVGGRHGDDDGRPSVTLTHGARHNSISLTLSNARAWCKALAQFLSQI